MTLQEKILKIYPLLLLEDFELKKGTILLQNDGSGDYIKLWTNKNPQPTAEELAAITG